VQVRWLAGAADSLEAIHEYLAQDNVAAADRMVEIVLAAVSRLSEHPNMGRPGRVLGTRELVISGASYIIPYRVRAERIEILRVYHGARRWPGSF
jgi:toxin ParE1/3/4